MEREKVDGVMKRFKVRARNDEMKPGKNHSTKKDQLVWKKKQREKGSKVRR